MRKTAWAMALLLLAALLTGTGARQQAPPPQEPPKDEKKSQEKSSQEKSQEKQESSPPSPAVAEQEQSEEESLSLGEELPGIVLDKADAAENENLALGGAAVKKEEVTVWGRAWRKGERMEYVLLFDHVPIGRQAYSFAGTGLRKDAAEGRRLDKTADFKKPLSGEAAKKNLAVVFDFFHTMDMRFFGTPGRAVVEGRLVMDLQGKPLYYRVEENFDPFSSYDVNRPLVDNDDFRKHQIWFENARVAAWGESRLRREDAERHEAPSMGTAEAADMILDFPFLGHFAMHFQLASFEKLSKKKREWRLRALAPFERPALDYFAPQNVHAAFAPRLEKLSYRVEPELRPKEAGLEAAKKKIYRVTVSPLGWTLWFDEKGKMLRADTKKGLSLLLASAEGSESISP